MTYPALSQTVESTETKFHYTSRHLTHIMTVLIYTVVIRMPTKRSFFADLRVSFIISIGVILRGLLCLCNWTRRRTRHGAMDLAVPHYDDGIPFRKSTAGYGVVDLAPLPGSPQPVGAKGLCPVGIEESVSFSRIKIFVRKSYLEFMTLLFVTNE